MGKHLLTYYFLVLALLASAGLVWADSYVHVIHDTIIKIDTQNVCTVDTVVIHDTCRVIPQTAENVNRHSGMWDFWLPLLVSVLGTFVALILTYLLLRPKFEIYPIAAQALNNRVWFVVKNKSWCAKLYNIKAELAYIRHNDFRNDTEIIPIDLDLDSSLSVISAANGSDENFYVFHTKEAFVRDEQYKQVRLRVSATNTISNIFDAKDKVFNYTAINTFESKTDDIRWGIFDKDVFVPIELMYNENTINLVKQIIGFNESVMRVFIPRTSKKAFTAEKAIWDAAEEKLLSIKKGGQLYANFKRLKEIEPVINKVSGDFNSLKEVYKTNITLTYENLDKRDKLVKAMKRNIVLISRYMQGSLTKI